MNIGSSEQIWIYALLLLALIQEITFFFLRWKGYFYSKWQRAVYFLAGLGSATIAALVMEYSEEKGHTLAFYFSVSLVLIFVFVYNAPIVRTSGNRQG